MLCAAALAGCGDELEEFRDEELRPLEQKAESQRSEISGVLQDVTLGRKRDAELLRTKVAALEATYSELAELDPPDDYDATYRDFIVANRSFVKELRAFADALEARREDEVQRASKRARIAIGDSREALLPLYD